MEVLELNMEDLKIEIKRVKDISFFVNEQAYVHNPSKSIKIEMNQTLGTNADAKLLNFTLRVFLRYEDSPPGIVLADLYVQNIFEVSALPKFIKEGGLALPGEILISIVSLSISHSRALLAKNLAGTVYQEVILPITNSIDVTNYFFPGVLPSQPATEKVGIREPQKVKSRVEVKKRPSKNSY